MFCFLKAFSPFLHTANPNPNPRASDPTQHALYQDIIYNISWNSLSSTALNNAPAKLMGYLNIQTMNQKVSPCARLVSWNCFPYLLGELVLFSVSLYNIVPLQRDNGSRVHYSRVSKLLGVLRPVDHYGYIRAIITEGNVKISVCLSLSIFVCLSVCLSVSRPLARSHLLCFHLLCGYFSFIVLAPSITIMVDSFRLSNCFLLTAERLTNFDILVYRQKLSFDESPKVADDIKCNWQLFRGKPPVGVALIFACRRILKGQYITILKDPPESLELCEVQVFGYSYRGELLIYFVFT